MVNAIKNITPIKVPFRLCRTGQSITEAWKWGWIIKIPLSFFKDTFQWPTQNNENAISSLPGPDVHDVLVITPLLEVIVINIIRIIIIGRVFVAVSNVITKLIPTIDAAAKITAFTSCLPRLRSISLAQPGLTTCGTASAAGCSHVITGAHSPLNKPSFYLTSLSQSLNIQVKYFCPFSFQRRHPCLQTLLKFVIRETKESFVARTNALLVGVFYQQVTSAW